MRLGDLLKGHGRTFGAVISGLVALGALYECIAIVTPGVPTISREWQGLRDSSPAAADVLAIAVAGISALLTAFNVWLVHHFREDRRSSL